MPPMPVRTVTRPPDCVYSTALPIRLTSSSRSRNASPRTPAAAISNPRSTSFASDRCTHSSAHSSTTWRRSMRANSEGRLPPGSARASASSWLARRAVRMVALCTYSSSARQASGTGWAIASSVWACSPASGVRSWCAALARNRCWLRFDSSTWSKSLLRAETRGLASVGAPPSLIARRSRGERSRISSDKRASGARPRVMPNHTSARVSTASKACGSTLPIRMSRDRRSRLIVVSATLTVQVPAPQGTCSAATRMR